MVLPSLTTELEAVNAILASVGESPIVSLTDAFVDAEMARNLLTQRIRATLITGWTFNTDTNITLTPTNDGTILVPPTWLRYDIEDKNLVVRGGKLFDRSTQSSTFTAAVTVTEAIVLLAFEDLPEAMRQYVTIAAGRRFQDRYQGDDRLHQFQARDEMAAWAALLNHEAETADYNILTGSRLLMRIKQNR